MASWERKRRADAAGDAVWASGSRTDPCGAARNSPRPAEGGRGLPGTKGYVIYIVFISKFQGAFMCGSGAGSVGLWLRLRKERQGL